jgi:glycosyltransferase involved in cell wall biosynthesis
MYLHTRADYVTVNSHAARLAIGRRQPQLRAKLITTYNAVNLGPCGATVRVPAEPSEIRLIAAARLDRNKNPHGLLAALHALRTTNPSLRLCVDWYGSQDVEPEVLREVLDGIAELELEGMFRLHPPTDDIHDLMSHADAVVLPSYNEGLPNAVCEGMALGKPILMSAVCDAGNLVQEGVNGFLFDPHSPQSIADAIARFASLASEERGRMGKASRAKAEMLFDVGTVADRYLSVLEAAVARKALKIEHWPKEVPDTALRSLSESGGGGFIRG